VIELMRDVSFIADVAVLPRWIRVFAVARTTCGGVHPRFDRAKAESFLAKTTIKRTKKVRELSKAWLRSLHLAARDGYRRSIALCSTSRRLPGHFVSQSVLRFTAKTTISTAAGRSW